MFLWVKASATIFEPSCMGIVNMLQGKLFKNKSKQNKFDRTVLS